MALSAQLPAEDDVAKKKTREAARNKLKAHPAPAVVTEEKSLPFFHADTKDEAKDFAFFDAAIDKDHPQPGLLSRVFDHVQLSPELMQPILNLCQDFKQEAKHFGDRKSADYSEALSKNVNKAVFNDQGGFQVWVLATILKDVSNEEKLAAAIKNAIFNQVKALICNEKNQVNKLYRDFFGESRIKKALEIYGSYYVATCFATGLASQLCGVIGSFLKMGAGDPLYNMVGTFIALIQHQLKTNSQLLEIYYEVSRQREDHSLGDEDELKKFIVGLKEDCLKKLPFVDSGKYIPLLTLAKKVMQLQIGPFAYEFAEKELLWLMKKFEEIRKDGSNRAIDKYNNLNANVNELILAVDKMLVAFAPDEGKANLTHIIQYQQKKMQDQFSEFNLTELLGENFLAKKTVVVSEKGEVSFNDVLFKSITKKVNELADMLLGYPELTCQLLIYLMNGKDIDTDFLFNDIMIRLPTSERYLSLLSLINAIEQQQSGDKAMLRCYQTVTEDLILDLRRNTWTLDTFSKMCDDAFSYYTAHHSRSTAAVAFVSSGVRRLEGEEKDVATARAADPSALFSAYVQVLQNTANAARSRRVQPIAADLLSKLIDRELKSIDDHIADKDDLLSVAAGVVCRDALMEYYNISAGRSNVSQENIINMLTKVNNVLNQRGKANAVVDLTLLLANMPRSTLISGSNLFRGLLVFTGIAAMVVGFALSPFTSFTSAYFGCKAAAACMVAGGVFTGVGIFASDQTKGLAKSLGGFISVANSEKVPAVAPALGSAPRV